MVVPFLRSRYFQRSWPGLAVLVALVASSPGAGQTPPRELHQVGDHWTAWNPPESLPEGAQVHTIEPGDTLWSLAERIYGDPYLWPQIWERNQYIQDAHWIYPGDPLVLGIEVAPGQETSMPGDTTQAPGEEGIPETDPRRLFGSARNTFIQLGKPDDIYCSGYLGKPNESFPYRIAGSEYEVLGPTLTVTERGKIEAQFGSVDAIKYGLDTGDIIYLDGGRSDGLAPGDLYTVVEPGEKVSHPVTKRSLGRFYAYLARVRVLSVQDRTAIAEITQSCRPVVVGARLKPFEPEPVPSERKTPMRPVNQPTSWEALRNAPTIVYSKDGIVSLGQDHVVFIDRGEEADVTPGDIYTIYRLTRRQSPPVVLGELAVLSVHDRSSVAKIIESRYPIYVGDLLEQK